MLATYQRFSSIVVLVALMVAMDVAPAPAIILWDWSFAAGTEAGQIETTGDPSDLGASGTFAVTNVSVIASAVNAPFGDVQSGPYSFGASLGGGPFSLDWDGNQVSAIHDGVDQFGAPGTIDITINNVERLFLGLDFDSFQQGVNHASMATPTARVGTGGNPDMLITPAISLECDFNGDASCDVADIDMLVGAIASGSTDLMFDLNGDTAVTLADRDSWLAVAGAENLPSGAAYLVGDANLDSTVDGQDFIVWNTNKFTSVAAWSAGDFTADGVVDGQDFIQWNDNKFMSADQMAAVPEPNGFACLLFAIGSASLMRRARGRLMCDTGSTRQLTQLARRYTLRGKSMLRSFLTASAVSLILVHPALAQTTWIGSGDGVNWTDGANWSTGIEPNNVATDVVIDGNGGVATAVELDTNRSVGMLTIDVGDELEMLRFANLNVNGGVSNNGTISANFFGVPSGGTNITFSSTQALSGNGELIFADEPLNRIGLAQSGSILTHNAGHTIRGAALLDVPASTRVINNGTIIAEGDTHEFLIEHDNTNTEFTNNGVLRAAGAAGLRLSFGVFVNNNLIEALDASIVNVTSGTTIQGGNLTTNGTGQFNFSGFIDLDGVTATTGSRITVGETFGAAIDVLNGLTNNGQINFHPANGSRIAFQGAQSLNGTGELVLPDTPNSVVDIGGNNAVLVHGPNHTIRGAGTMISNINTVVLQNEGTIVAEGANNPLIIDPGTGGAFVNNGATRAVGAAGLELRPGLHVNTSTIEATSGSTVRIATGSLMIGGQLSATGTGTIQAVGFGAFPAPILDSVTTTAGTPLIVDSATDNARLDLVNGFTNNGSVMLNPSANTANTNLILTVEAMTIDGSGEIVLPDTPNNDIIAISTGAQLTNGPNHTIRGAGRVLDDRNDSSFRNEGTVLAGGASHPLRIDPGQFSSMFTNVGTVRATGAAGLRLEPGIHTNEGLIDTDANTLVHIASGAAFANTPTGTVGGNGRFEFADGSFANDGGVVPGQSLGTLTVAADVTNSITAMLDIELDTNTSDLLDIQGAYTAGGDLNIDLIAGSVDPQQEFTILTASNGVSGFFENAVPNGSGVANHLVDGELFDVTYEANAIKIQRQEPIPPTPASMQITEIYTGVTGEDGTLDWIEVTNLGGTPADTGTLIYDDESLNINRGGDLPSFILGPGESAIFLVDDDNGIGETQAIADFHAIWGPVPNVGYTEGGGGLPAAGNDAAAIMLADGSIVDVVYYPELPNGAAGAVTVDISDGGGTNGILGFSTLGINDAYESNPFFNNDIGSGDPPMITIIGSPGFAGDPIIGDFNGDGQYDITDLNQLLSFGPIAGGVAVVPGVNDQFDLNGDGQINLDDRDIWLADAATANGFASPFKLGDANLDGTVDGQDFVSWNAHKFTSTLQWQQGDFNGDGFADGQDFIQWNSNKFSSSDAAIAAVPEPQAAGALLLLCSVCMLTASRRRESLLFFNRN